MKPPYDLCERCQEAGFTSPSACCPSYRIKWVKQRTDWDCSYACIAMACGVTLEEVIAVSSYDGAMYESEMLRVIAHFQHLPIYIQGDTLYPDRTHIICVPSLNLTGLNHSIVVKTFAPDEPVLVLDPQQDREGKKFYTTDNLKCWSRVLWVQNCRWLG